LRKGESLNGLPSSFHSIEISSDEILVERGHPVEQIVRIAKEHNIDLIVMGRHGHGALKDALMGGVARGVLRHSAKPVLLVKLPEEEG